MAILRNAARCLRCGEEVESQHTHDFVRCSCGNVAVDGGPSYLRRQVADLEFFEDVSVCTHKPANWNPEMCFNCRAPLPAE